MGMFDSFFFHCQKCGAVIEEQSKAGPCGLNRYTILNMHPAVAGDLHGRKGKCRKCGWYYLVAVQITISVFPWDDAFDPDPEDER